VRKKYMIARVLVAYATQKGSTAEVAQAIGKELQAMGHTVSVQEMRSVKSLDGYELVIIGAPVYVGKIIEMGGFVGRHKQELATRAVAAFAVGMAPVSHDQKQVDAELEILRVMFETLQPVTLALFAGKVDMGKLNFIQRTMINMVKSPVGDFRDWKTIAAWAREVAEKIGM
jgi:menaquinone-dependent protoporphyrinogen oxidase